MTEMKNIAPLALKWCGKGAGSVSTLHQLSPYIGRTKPAMARVLIDEFTEPGQTIFDPYCGSGTVVLEGWLRGRNVVGNDLNPYAVAITKGKLNPPSSYLDIEPRIREITEQVKMKKSAIDLRTIPYWVRAFFHPETLRELLVWFDILKDGKDWFLLACLLGILHHQRPGFLSFPSSHAVPYLRNKKFPRQDFPSLYEYRDVASRLERKVKRMLAQVPDMEGNLRRICSMVDSANLVPKLPIDAIISSPPYMGRLAYGRDNRLRLWFLGFSDIKLIDEKSSPNMVKFLKMIRHSLGTWLKFMQSGKPCILILGDEYLTPYRAPLYEAVSYIAINEVGGYRLESMYSEPIPDKYRVRRGCNGNKTETVLVLRVK